MSCSACDALKAKNKTCWRHPKPAMTKAEEIVQHFTGGMRSSPVGFTPPSGPAAPVVTVTGVPPFPLPVGTVLGAGGYSWIIQSATTSALGTEYYLCSTGTASTTFAHADIVAGWVAIISMPSAGPPGPINHQANLDLLFPAHATHIPFPLPIATMSFQFACSCGTLLEYYVDASGVPKALGSASSPLPVFPLPVGTVLQFTGSRRKVTIESVVPASVPTSSPSLAGDRYWIKDDLGVTGIVMHADIKPNQYVVISTPSPSPQSVPGGVPGAAGSPPIQHPLPVGTKLRCGLPGGRTWQVLRAVTVSGPPNTYYEVEASGTLGVITDQEVDQGTYTVVP